MIASRRNRWLPVLLALLLVVLAVALQIANGAYAPGAMIGADDPAHFVSGLMVRDYLAHAAGDPPVEFATAYYAHYPKVAIGNWPPVFYAIQGVWMLVLPARPESVLLLLASMAAATAWLTWRALRAVAGDAAAVGGAVLLLVLRPMQAAGVAVLAEIPVTLFCTIAAWYWMRFMRDARTRDVALFGLWSAIAVFTKQNGLLVMLIPSLAIAIGRRWDLLRSRALWTSAGVAAIVSATWIWRHLPTMREGWQAHDQIFADLGDVGYYPLALVRTLGPLAAVVAAIGAWDTLPRVRRREEDAVWATAAAAVVATVLFHSLAPAGHQSRHLLPAYPFVAMFVAAGVGALTRRIAASRWSRAWAGGALIVVVAIATNHPRRLRATPRPDGYALAAELVTAGFAGLEPTSVLVSAAAPGEGAIVVEVAVRDPDRPTHTVWRGSKLLAQSTWAGRRYKLRTDSDSGVLRLLDYARVRWVVVDPSDAKEPHRQLLKDAIAAFPARFVLHRHIPLRSTLPMERDSLAVYRLHSPPDRPPPVMLRQVPGYEGLAVTGTRND